MMALGRDLELVQRHKAEEDMAVAAASILARDEFVTRLQRLGAQFGVHLPKGASPRGGERGPRIHRQAWGERASKIAKMHFRTAYRVQGLPEPPKVEWRKPAPKRALSKLRSVRDFRETSTAGPVSMSGRNGFSRINSVLSQSNVRRFRLRSV